MGKRNTYRILVQKSVGKRTLKCEDNINSIVVFNTTKGRILAHSTLTFVRQLSVKLELLPNRHRGPEEWWSSNATIEDWFDEMVGQANIINRFAGVRMEDIRGMEFTLLLNTTIPTLLLVHLE
jgi:hypothetical protein